jgi:SAM-dependent methyltransferase
VAPSTTGNTTGAYRRYAEVYDLVWRAAPWDRFVDLCLDAAGSVAVSARRVVDAACGTGNLAIEFARRGHEVTGFDLSRGMLERAAAKRSATGLRVGLVVGDLRAAPLADGCADLVVSLNASLNYLLEPDEVVTALGHLGRLASPSGAIVLEPLAGRFIHQGYEPARHVVDGAFRLDASYELKADLLIERVAWTIDGIDTVESYCQRYYDDEQFEALLGAAGLVVAGRLPMYPFLEAEPARGRTLWVIVP